MAKRWARKSHRDSAVRFVTAKRGPERATKTRQYVCYGQELARKSHQDSQYDLLRPNVGQKEPPKLGSTICYGQELARKNHQDSAVRFVTAKSCPERATKTRQYDLLRPRVGQKEPTKTRQYDLLRPNVGQKEPPKLGSTICYGQELARKSHQNSAVRFVTAKRGPERATKNSAVRFVTVRKNHQDSAVRFVTAKSWPERATKTRQYDLLRPRVGQKEPRDSQYDLLRPNVGQKEPPKLGSTICYGQELARKKHTKTRQYDLLRPNVGQKEPPKLGSTICYGQTWARKSHQNSAVRFVTAKSWPERATKTRQYDLLRPNVGQKEPPKLGSTICYGQELARKSHQDSAVRFVTAKRGPERATKTRQYDLLRPRVGQKEPPRLGSTICCGQTWARKSHQDSAVRFVTAKRWPERATKTRQHDLLRPRVGQKEPPRLGSTILLRPNVGQKEPPKLGSTICYGQELARKNHQDSAVRFVTAKSCPERATKTRQYDLLRPNVGQKEPPRLGSTICYGQTWARKSHQNSAVRFVTAKSWPERATKTRQYDLLRPNVGRKSHQNSAVRFVTAKRGPERATETRQYDLLRPNVGQKEPPRLGSTICYGQELARKSTKTRQYDLLRPNVGEKEPPKLGSTICYGQELARKSHQDSAVRFVTAKRGPERATKLGSTICYGQTWARKSHQDSAVRFVTTKRGPERATKTRQYDLLRPRVGQKEPPRLGSTILLRPNVGQKEPPKLGSTICYGQELARKSHQDSAVRFVTAKRGPERATKTRQYDLLRPNVGQKEPPKPGSTICYGQELARKSHQDSAVRFVTAKTWARKSHQNSAVRFVTAKSWPDRATTTRQCDLLRPNVGQKEPPRLGSTICYGQTWARKEPPKLGSTVCYGQELARKSHQDSAVRFVTAKRGPERATKTRQYDLLRPSVGQKEPPRLGSTICYGQELSRKSHQDSAVRFVTAKSWPERATKTRQYDLLRPNVGQKEPPKLGSTICYGQELARKSHQDSAVRFVTAKRGARKSHQNSAVRFVTAKSWSERTTKTRQYDLLRPRVGQKEPPRLGSTICYGQELARKSHRDSAVRFVTTKRGPERATKTRQYDLFTAKSWPERATKTRQYDLLRPNVGQKEPPELGSTICYGQELARKSHQDSAVRFVAAKRGPERATKTRQYDLLRPNVGQKEPPKLGSTICYGQELARKSHQDSAVRFVYGQTWARKSHQNSAVRFVTAKSWPERATKTRQYVCCGQTWARKSHQDSAVRFVTAKRWPERATKTRQYDLLRSAVRFVTAKTWARKSHQNSAVRFVTAKSWPERSTKTRQSDLLRPRVVQKEPPRLGNTICYGQTWARKSHRDSAVRFVTAKRGPERATKTRQYDLLRPRVGQKEPPRLGSTICCGQTWARKSHQNSAVRFVTAKSWPERTTKTRQYDLLRPRVVQKEPPRLGSTICYGQELARKSHQDSAVRFVTAKRGPERATKTRQYDLLRPRVGQKEPPRLGSTICCGQTWARKSHQNSAVRFVTANVSQKQPPKLGSKEPPRLGSTICYSQTRARKNHRDSAVRFVTAKSCPERATKTRQYDLLRPKSWPDRATKTRQYDLLRPNVGQKEPPRLGSTICYGQTWARKSHQNSAVQFVTAKCGP